MMKMKKLLSAVLSLILVFSTCSVAFANTDECNCGRTPVIYVRGMGEPLYENPENGCDKEIFATMGDTAKESIPEIILGVLGLLTFNYDLFGKYAIEVADRMLEKLEFDENGTPLYNTGIEPMESPDYQTHLNDIPMCDADVDGYTDSCYYFRYDWRVSPLDNARILNEYALEVMQVTKHSKVSFVCHSQGNTIMASYLYLFGNEHIDKIAFLSPAYQGVALISSIFTKDIDIGGNADAIELFVSAMTGGADSDIAKLMKFLNFINVLDGVVWWLDGVLDSQFDRIFEEYLSDAFGNLPGVWAFVTPDDYDTAKLNVFGENYTETDYTRKLDEYHYNVQQKLPELIADAMESGTEVMICSGYNIPVIPVNQHTEEHSDMLINTLHMSLGATTAPIGKTFENGYVQAVNDCGHNHVSADMIVDASTCKFPEVTWFFKGLDHVTYPEDYIYLINKFLDTPEQVTVHTFEEYPQFLEYNGQELTAV